MKIVGLIAEYNPFHNGHLYHIERAKEITGADSAIVVMSGNYVQRGAPAIMPKHLRAEVALEAGADIIFELPVCYACASAEYFAAGAVSLFEQLNCVDSVCFGSECGDAEKLQRAMETIEVTAVVHDSEIRQIMEKGYTYPRALSSVIRGIDPESAEIISSPNNMLAIEYLRALGKFTSPIVPFTLKRVYGSHNGLTPENGFASSSFMRERLAVGKDVSEISEYTTPLWTDAIANAVRNGATASLERLERVLLYKLRSTSAEEIAHISDVGQGLENRIYGARMAGSLEELLFTVKTKRYTMSRIRRIMLSLLIGITRNDMKNFPAYGRILAFNERGTEILSRAKYFTKIPYSTSIAKLSQINESAERFAELEIRASDVYGLALETVTSAQRDYRAKIMIDME